MKRIPVVEELLKLSPDDISRTTGETAPTIYSAIKAGHLKTFLVGRRRFAMRDDVIAWLTFLKKRSDAGNPVSCRPRDPKGETLADPIKIDTRHQAAANAARKAQRQRQARG